MSSFYESINKKKSIADASENAQSRAAIDKWIFRLFLVLLGVMPLIVLANTEEVVSPLVSNIDVLSSGIKGELFTHFKALFVLLITIIASLLFLMKIYFMDGQVKKTWLNYVLGAFVVSIVVSTIASPNITIALNGQYNRSDGAISWLCYVSLMFIAMNIEYPKNFVRYIMYVMMPFVYINLIIITMNFYGKDLLQNYSWVKSFVSISLPEGSNLSESSQLVGTLNQWNYMSGMFAMMTVMYLAWAITSKKWHEVVIGAITASASIAVMFMSISTSGFLTVLATLIVLIVAIFRVEKKTFALVGFLVFLVISAPAFHILADKNPKVWTESFGFFTESNPYVTEVTAMLQNENVAYASEQVLALPVLPERAISAGSGRTYIWGKTLNMSKERIFIGYGMDSLTYNFPHYNIDARSGILDENTIVDKPHNTYVGTIYGFGIVGFITLIVVIAMAIAITGKTIMYKTWGAFIIGLTVVAYGIQAVFNDSLPGVSAIAWVLIGMLFVAVVQERKGNLENGRND